MFINTQPHVKHFAYELPYWTVEDDLLIHVDGSITKGLALQGVDTWTMSEERLNEYSESLKIWISTLPTDIFVQIVTISDEDTTQAYEEYKKDLKLSSQQQICIFNDRKQLLESSLGRRYRLFLFVTKIHSEPKSSFFKLGKKNDYDLKKRHDDALKQLNRLCADLSAHFNRSEIQIKTMPLKKEDYYDLLYELLNPKKNRLFKKTNKTPHDVIHSFDSSEDVIKPFVTLREKVASSGCEENKHLLILDNTFVRVITLSDLPDITYPAMLESLVYKLDFPFYLSTSFQILDTPKYLEKLRSRNRRKKGIVNISRYKSKETEVSSQEMDDLETHIVSSGEKVGAIAISLVIMADNEETLEIRTHEALTRFKSLSNASARVEEYSQRKYFLASLPGNSHLGLERHHVCTSNNIGHLLPLSTPWSGTKEKWVLLHSDRQSLFGFSPFSHELSSYNQIVIGQTGVGKSFFVNLLLNLYLLKKPDLQIFILDRGGSYKKFVEFWGGQYVDFDLNDPKVSITPFIDGKQLWNPETGEYDRKAIGRIAAITEQMVIDPNQDGLGRLEFAVLEEAIRCCYAQHRESRPTFKDLQNTLLDYAKYTTDSHDIQTARDLGKRLSPWTDGAYSKLFCGAPPLEVKNKIFCFDIQGTVNDKNVLGVIYATVGNHLFDVITLNIRPTIFVCDEMWETLLNRLGEMMLERASRTGRKNYLSMLTATQGSIEYNKSKAAKTVLNQSKIRWILKIRENPEEMKETLQLTDRECDLTKHLSMLRGVYSQALLQCDEFRTVATIYSTPLLYWMSTTNPKERQIEQKYSERYPDKSLVEILALLAKEYPKGYEGD